MRQRTRAIAAAAASGMLAGSVALAVGTSASAAPSLPSHDGGDKKGTATGEAVGLSLDGKTLSTFSVSRPSGARDRGPISGLAGDARLIGIDWRASDGAVYGVGNGGGIYTLDPRSATATKVSQLTVALEGRDFGVDFNPAADRLRVVSDTGQNLRHNPVPGGETLVDGTLAYTPGTPARGITAGAYTNNDVSAATGTTLFDIDSLKDQVVQQVPANDGTLVLAGPLGIKVSRIVGFDIASTVRRGDTVANAGYATMRPSAKGRASLYTIDLLSGSASRVGAFAIDVADLTVVPRG